MAYDFSWMNEAGRGLVERLKPRAPDIYAGNKDLERAVGREGDLGNTASQTFLHRAQSFDPMSSIRDYARGAYNVFESDLGENLSRLRGGQVGMGRLDTGFATKDEDRLYRDSLDRLNNNILQQSLTATEMGQANNRALADFGTSARNTHLDALAGLTMTKRQQELENKASKRGFWGQVGGGLLAGAGMAVGALSDERAKENIRPMEGAMDRVGELDGYDFDYNPEAMALGAPPGPTGGVMAQDVAGVAPEAVGEMPGGFMGVDYMQVVGMLTEAVKELEDRLRSLEGGKKVRA